MTPEKIAKANTEHAHQAAVFCWASLSIKHYPELKWMHAIPNGGLRNKATAARLVAEGVKKGVSDVFLPFPIRKNNKILYCGLYIEMKKPGGKASKEQKEFLEDMAKVGYKAVICYDWLEAVQEIKKYLYLQS